MRSGCDQGSRLDPTGRSSNTDAALAPCREPRSRCGAGTTPAFCSVTTLTSMAETERPRLAPGSVDVPQPGASSVLCQDVIETELAKG
jgi:hypothetical protein